MNTQCAWYPHSSARWMSPTKPISCVSREKCFLKSCWNKEWDPRYSTRLLEILYSSILQEMLGRYMGLQLLTRWLSPDLWCDHLNRFRFSTQTRNCCPQAVVRVSVTESGVSMKQCISGSLCENRRTLSESIILIVNNTKCIIHKCYY